MKTIVKRSTKFGICLNIIVLLACSINSKTVSIRIIDETYQTEFAYNELKNVLTKLSYEVTLADNENTKIVFISSEDAKIQSEGFVIKKDKGSIHIISSNAAGAMNGGLELA